MKLNLKPMLLMAFIALITSCAGDSRPRSGPALQPYYEQGPYSDLLAKCVSVTKVADSCRLSELPTLGMQTASPTIDDVMQRVVVTDAWMGENFEALLGALPEDILYLMRGVTAVVIGREIRPSYYWSLTGAIYLDPANLWLTLAEHDLISTEPDYRSAYSEPMAFRAFWRWTRAGGSAWAVQGLNSDGVRPLADIIYPMASLLFHELAHANDLLPPALYDTVQSTDTVYSASSRLHPHHPSTQLAERSSLTSDAMYHFASILYHGLHPSEQDKATTAWEIGGFFEPDRANDNYNYTSQYEDLAMLFEEAMMKIAFDIDRDIAFVTPTAPEGVSPRCDDYIIGWGERNRVGDIHILPRAQFALEALLPERDFTQALAALPLPSSLPRDVGWCAALTQSTQLDRSSVQKLQFEPPQPAHSERLYRIFDGF